MHALELSLLFAGIIIICVYIQQGHFLLSPFYWIDLRIYRAVTNKRFRRPLSSYGYEKVHSDEYGTLWKLKWQRLRGASKIAGEHYLWSRSQSIIRSREYLVEVVCPSTKKTYYLPVPSPRLAWRVGEQWFKRTTGNWPYEWRSAKAAIAWTFDMSEDEYDPVIHT